MAKRTKALTEAKRAVELERDSAMAMADTFESERDTALRQPGAEDRGAAPHRHGGQPGNGGEGQDHRTVAGCAEIEPGYSEHHRRYSLQGKRGVQASH